MGVGGGEAKGVRRELRGQTRSRAYIQTVSLHQPFPSGVGRIFTQNRPFSEARNPILLNGFRHINPLLSLTRKSSSPSTQENPTLQLDKYNNYQPGQLVATSTSASKGGGAITRPGKLLVTRASAYARGVASIFSEGCPAITKKKGNLPREAIFLARGGGITIRPSRGWGQ